jgi:sialate O-acetylesterase
MNTQKFIFIVKKMPAFLLLCLTYTLTYAKIELPAIISPYMVLQQNTTIKLWGKSTLSANVVINCSWEDENHTVTCRNDGKWDVCIKTPSAGGPYKITISDAEDKTEINHVLIGEVWFCSGQSNMEFPMGTSDAYWHTGVINYETEIKQANYPYIRLFTVKKQTAEKPVDTCRGAWVECTPESVSPFSAVAYYFGRMLYQQLKVPIGLINSSWGGTPAESWTRREILENDTTYKCIFENYQRLLDAYPEGYKKYKEELEKWRKGVEEGTITGMDAKRPPREPIGPGHHKTPSVLYNGMVAPIIPYSIRGVIWYQGESNANNPSLYAKLFPDMIKNWRDDWKQGDFPFYFVQISAHNNQNPYIREAQMKTMKSVPNTGMVVTLDVGDSLDIHPRDKKTVGERLALWALSQTYNIPGITCSGPIYKSMTLEGNTIKIYFDHTGSGLVSRNNKLSLFEISGEDGVFVNADAQIYDNTIVVSSEKVKHPVAARYAWKNYMVPDLFNKEGLPASSFRTNDN